MIFKLLNEQYLIKVYLVRCLYNPSVDRYVHLLWYLCVELGLLTKIMEEKGYNDLGPFQFTITFAVTIIFSMVYLSFPIRIKAQCLLVSSLFAFSFLITWVLLHANTQIVHLLSTIIGIMQGIAYSLMIVVGRYLAILCEGEEENTKASYFSIYGVIVGSSGILSAIVSLFSLGFFGSDIFLWVLALIQLVATALGFLVLEDLNDSQQPSDWQLGLILPNLKKMVVFYPVLWNVLPLMMLNGVVIGVISSTMMHFLPADQDSEKVASFGTFFHGAGAWIFGYVCLKLNDCLSLKACSYFIVFLYLLACTVGALTASAQNLWVSFFAMFLWGALMFGSGGFINLVLCKAYDKKAEGYVISVQLRKVLSLIYSLLCTTTHNSLSVPLFMLMIALFIPPTIYCLHHWYPSCD